MIACPIPDLIPDPTEVELADSSPSACASLKSLLHRLLENAGREATNSEREDLMVDALVCLSAGKFVRVGPSEQSPHPAEGGEATRLVGEPNPDMAAHARAAEAAGLDKRTLADREAHVARVARDREREVELVGLDHRADGRSIPALHQESGSR